MDFASLMSAQIAKTASKQPASLPPPSTSAPLQTRPAPPAKYLKRSDAEQARQTAYLAEQAAATAARAALAQQKRQRDDEEHEREAQRAAKRQRLAAESRQRREEDERAAEAARRKRLGLAPLPDQNGGADNDDDASAAPLPAGQEDMTDAELTDKLRALREPATLFGETHAQRLRRYARLTAPPPALVPEKQAATRERPIPTSLAPVGGADMLVSATLPPAADAAARLLLARQLTSWFTLVLREWATALSGRTAAVASSSTGRAAAASLAQATAHLAPLYRRLERGELADELLGAVAGIAAAAQARRYVAAGDAYLRLSIGRAAWPIGVTMVGIHERSAREKLHGGGDGDKAHIMADETTRKMLQAIKRCLTFAQTRWPPEDSGQLMG